MSFTIHETKEYAHPAGDVQQAALGAVAGLQGKVLAQSDGQLEAKFDKTIHGKVLGDRTQFKVTIQPLSAEACQVVVEAFPIDAVGRKLMFGARKGVTRTVLDWYWAHLEHRLGVAE